MQRSMNGPEECEGMLAGGLESEVHEDLGSQESCSGRTRDQKVTGASAHISPRQCQTAYHAGCAVGHQDGAVEPVRKRRQQPDICFV